MRSVYAILSGASAVTDLLASGSNSIMHLEESQGAQMPYIVLVSDLIDPNDNQTAQNLDKYESQIFIVANQLYTDGGVNGASEIGEQIRTVMHGTSGSYGGDTVVDIKFDSDTTQKFNSTTESVVQLEQRYTVWIER